MEVFFILDCLNLVLFSSTFSYTIITYMLTEWLNS